MITRKSPEEVRLMREAGIIVRRVLEGIEKAVGVGVTTQELDDLALKIIKKSGAVSAFKGYKGYPAHICASVNEEVVHGIPSDRHLRQGDIIGVDVGVKLSGYFADAAETYAIGVISEEASRLLTVTRRALEAGIEKAVAGNRLSDISNAVQETVESNGFSVVRAFVGHGIGTKMHEAPEVPNFGRPNRGVRLESGMAIAIEPMVNAGTHEVKVLDNDWTVVTMDGSLSAHFEESIVITRAEPQVITARTCAVNGQGTHR